MSESISSTVKHTGLTLDSVFVEVQHSEGLGLPKANHIRFFHTTMRGNKLTTENLQVFLRRNLARYVFSRAQLENYRVNDDLDSAVSEAMRIMAENGDSSSEGTGNMLDEILVYAFLEEKLKAPKLLSRVELYTELAKFRSECKGIHLLSPSDLPENTKFQMVFGASNIVDDVKIAIDRAFETIAKINAHESREVLMVQKTVLDQFFNQDEVDLLTQVLIPQPGQPESYDTAYGIFLGYQLGLNPEGRGDDFEALAEQKMLYDIKEHAGYIAEKISAAGLTGHSFYVYVVPFNDAEQEKTQIMDAVLRGGTPI